MVIWAAGLPAADLIIPHMSPIALTACRALLATAVLLPIWWITEGGAAILGANWLTGAWVGFVTLGLASFFVIIALQFNDPVTVAIVTAIMPVAGILLECVADKRPFTRALAIGLVLSVAGGLVAVTGSGGSARASGSASWRPSPRSSATPGARVRRSRPCPIFPPLAARTITVAGCAIVATASPRW